MENANNCDHCGKIKELVHYKDKNGIMTKICWECSIPLVSDYMKTQTISEVKETINEYNNR